MQLHLHHLGYYDWQLMWTKLKFWTQIFSTKFCLILFTDSITDVLKLLFGMKCDSNVWERGRGLTLAYSVLFHGGHWFIMEFCVWCLHIFMIAYVYHFHTYSMSSDFELELLFQSHITQGIMIFVESQHIISFMGYLKFL
jgi:hypothetical protein